MDMVVPVSDRAGEENRHNVFGAMPSKIRSVVAYVVSMAVMLCTVRK